MRCECKVLVDMSRVEEAPTPTPNLADAIKTEGESITYATWGTVAGVSAVASILIISVLLILLTVHTNTWSTLTHEHLDDDELDQITGDVLEVNSLRPIDEDGSITFGSDVLLGGNVEINRTTAQITSQVVADEVIAITDIFIPRWRGYSVVYKSHRDGTRDPR